MITDYWCQCLFSEYFLFHFNTFVSTCVFCFAPLVLVFTVVLPLVVLACVNLPFDSNSPCLPLPLPGRWPILVALSKFMVGPVQVQVSCLLACLSFCFNHQFKSPILNLLIFHLWGCFLFCFCLPHLAICLYGFCQHPSSDSFVITSACNTVCVFDLAPISIMFCRTVCFYNFRIIFDRIFDISK